MKLKIVDIAHYIRENIGAFHERRIAGLSELKLNTVLKKKNPYLFKAKNLLTAEEVIRSLTDAFISSKEETIFGNWLEGLAIFVNKKVYGGRKSGITGIDLEFDKDGTRYIVAVKSGPNWGNSSQIKKMKTDFITAERALRTSHSGVNVRAINGCCYGKDNNPDKGSYFKYCGQAFWWFISNDKGLYRSIIEPLGYEAREKNDEFMESHARVVNKFTKEFTHHFCLDNGSIDWNKLVEFNSGARITEGKAGR